MKRTHHCAELTTQTEGKEVTLIGWVDSIRDHGSLVFVDLRDRKGMTQIVINLQNPELKATSDALKPESVIGIRGIVKLRSEETINSELVTGKIEVLAEAIEIYNIAKTLPFPLEGAMANRVNEDLRFSYRYLDLRKPKNQHLLRLRHKTVRSVRNYLDSLDFTEVELPILFKSTPEGAREFLVPSRLNPSQFYALSQSPQQYKQMLMVAGLERYYSLARCFRDEDLRADRQPEFTQIDLEMSFIDREDIYALMEGMFQKIWKDVLDMVLPIPFPRLSYTEAMNRYGVDKPDNRFALELKDFSAVFAHSAFKVFTSVISSGGVVKAFNAKALADITQGELGALEETAKSLGAKGLAFIKVEGGQWKSPIVKFLKEEEKQALQKELQLEDGDLVFFAADKWECVCAILGRIRLEAARLLDVRKRLVRSQSPYHFLWVVDFPLLLEEEGRYISAHHPFTAPIPEDVELLETAPHKVHGQHYDIVLNGVELGGGSIRIHQSQMQEKIFKEVLKIPEEIIEDRFGYLLEAFRYGAPPHGGIAIGLDRLVAVLGQCSSIREVIAFPKTQKGQDLMAKSPARVTKKQLEDLHL